MKIYMIPNNSAIQFKGFSTPNKKVITNIIKTNPTKEHIKKAEVAIQQQAQKMGLTIIKQVKLNIKKS